MLQVPCALWNRDSVGEPVRVTKLRLRDRCPLKMVEMPEALSLIWGGRLGGSCPLLGRWG